MIIKFVPKKWVVTKKILFLFLFVFLLFPTPLYGEGEPPLTEITPDRQGRIALSFEEALNLALLNNLKTLIAEEKTQEARGEYREALSGFLPQISAKVYQVRRTTNLVAEGFDPKHFQLPPGFRGVIGPYNNFDARIKLLQNLFDLSAIGDYQAGKSVVRLSKLQVTLAKEEVSNFAGLTYLNALRTRDQVVAAEADYKLAKTLFNLTRDLLNVGIATPVDLARAETALSQAKTRLIAVKTDNETAALQLKGVLMLPMGSPLQLTDSLTNRPEKPLGAPEAVGIAELNRPEIKIAKEEIKLRGYEHKAAVGRQVPSIGFGANVGASGVLPHEEVDPTYQFGGVLSIPIFDGGYTLGSIKVAKSKKRQAQMILRNLREQVDEEVRVALQKLILSSQKVISAKQTLKLALREMQLARDRYFAGTGDNIEVVQAQTTLAQARQTNVDALAEYNAARIQLATALGQMEGFKL